MPTDTRDPQAAGVTTPEPLRRRPATRRRGKPLRERALPYLLMLPAVTVVVVVLGYPLYWLVTLSFQNYGLKQILTGETDWVGLANYTALFTGGTTIDFLPILARTVVFTAVNVGLTIVLGVLIALLLRQMSRWARLLLTGGLIFVWATPVVVAIPIWQWMFDYQFGVLNWLLTKLGFDFTNHNWFADPTEGLAVITGLVVWGALPFVIIAVYAALMQVPGELEDAAHVDGAGAFATFWYIVYPIIKPIVLIMTSLQVIWDFQVFNQIWIMLGANPTPDYFLIGIFSFFTAFKAGEYGMGSAISVVMVVVLFVFGFSYIRQLVKAGEVR